MIGGEKLEEIKEYHKELSELYGIKIGMHDS